MDRQKQAIKILEQAQEILTSRLAERILTESTDLLEDSRGESYMNEIQLLYKQLGARLENVNKMLADLKSAQRPPRREVLRLQSRVHSHQTTTELAPVTLQTFAVQIQEQRYDIAEQFLATLFSVDRSLANRCTRHFANRLSEHPSAISRLAQLQTEAEAGRQLEVNRLLNECFGLTGLQSLCVMQTLRDRFGVAN